LRSFLSVRSAVRRVASRRSTLSSTAWAAATLAAGGVAGADFRVPLRLAGGDFVAVVDLRAALSARSAATPHRMSPWRCEAACPGSRCGSRWTWWSFPLGTAAGGHGDLPPQRRRDQQDPGSPASRTTASTVGDPLRFSDRSRYAATVSGYELTVRCSTAGRW
jgi:hypothetical protein